VVARLLVANNHRYLKCPAAIRVVLNTYHMTTLKKNNKVRTVGSCDTLGKLASKWCVDRRVSWSSLALRATCFRPHNLDAQVPVHNW